MASLENLPSDQRAVLELVLRRGRSYDDIAKLLSIDRAGVRHRALTALDTLAPQTGVPAERRALITDYLLGQLPSPVAEDTRNRLAESPSERAWARVLASELAPIAGRPLPEIPVEAPRAGAEQQGTEQVGAPRARARSPRRLGGFRREPVAAPAGVEARQAPAAAGETTQQAPAQAGTEAQEAPATPASERGREAPGERHSSRRGGAMLLGLGGLIAVVIAVVVVIALTSGGSSHRHRTGASAPSTRAGNTGTSATPIAQINLVPAAAGSKTAGVAVILRQGSTTGILIRAQNVPANGSHDAYAVWLYNSPTDTHLLGFVNPSVGQNGQLTTAGPLPSNASHYKQVLVTRETTGSPKAPGNILLSGTLAGV